MTTKDSAWAAAGCRAVVFDLDGTLVDSMPMVLESYADALAPFCKLTADEIFPLLGGPPERLMLELTGSAESAAVAMRRLEERGVSNAGLVAVFTEARKLLETLRGRVKLAVWTGRDRATAEAILDFHGLRAFFDAVVCGDDFKTNKPDPEGMLSVLGRLDVSAAEAVFAGDADADVLGGFAAGVRTVLIRSERTIPAGVIAKAWRVVEQPQQAYELLAGLVG
jgi:phosphoglycolate phosphatase/pyrophosphatase PpaX